eukprot:TRINITY_DN17212_c0_g1_i1.p1 TRINITY_DN17212_c0_g1~~TRINITY_DN17212_c0_g1_i1.p1  ORF type:complete len:151 (+),score=22.71 TRINITY_DN17212_c0_g1_i1:294-746(+)
MRPGAHEFLQLMAEHFEVVIFTAGVKSYADWVLREINADRFINHKLYRQHTTVTGTFFVKDLSRLGRDLRRVIIVDNVAESFQLQPFNGIMIKTWVGDKSDTALLELAPILREIAVRKVEDVRDTLKSFSEQIQRQSEMGLQNYQLTFDN